MLVVGKTDAFEQNYMAKFEQLATNHGVFVKYERDRAARDIGVHLTKDMKSGKKQVTNALVWFQMKGVMASTLSKQQFDADHGVRLSLDIEHLRHWYLDKEPTHLVVYVESADQFLVMNLQEYIANQWGRGILELDQKTVSVTVPASSVLDDQAFAILLRCADIAQWAKALGTDHEDTQLIRRDYNLIYAIGTAGEREVEYGVLWRKWLSKMRDELRVAERPANFDGNADDGWDVVHEHWQYGGIDPEESYPYLELFNIDDYEPETITNHWGEEELLDDGEFYTLKNGESVFGPNAANEYCEFVFGARLNDYGQKLCGYVQALIKMGLLEVREPGDEERTFLDIAPWNSRLV
ncbi:DUF4365 domain-containing protein [Paraburkholderia sp. A1RO-5]|uniref:DUF4365 domain-containing protein n=1 Tax=Paraburkholderia sp. A1RO-5 TaxID=3028369 RepID=UPI003B7D703C